MHMEQFFENAKSVQRAIEFTQRFERSVLVISCWYVYTAIEKDFMQSLCVFLGYESMSLTG